MIRNMGVSATIIKVQLCSGQLGMELKLMEPPHSLLDCS